MAGLALTFLTLAAATAPAWAQPLIYPARGQSAQQQDRDRYECHEWARAQSGYDPSQPAAVAMAPASAPTPAPTGAGRSAGSSATAGGMAIGAMGAAAVAELTHHDAGRAAAVGALGGGLAQRIRQQQAAQAQPSAQQQQQQQQQQALAMQQQQAMRQQQRSTYERAMAACLEGRGYTVK
ncbi:MAG: hypothetical protein HZC37_03685 [Burkholderiales bacterium]|nr:hypothetical protein [Burkholderiales bacterium]